MVLALFLSGWPLRNFIMIGVVALPLLAMLLVLKPYQMARVQGFLDGWRNIEAAPYQVRQSLTTIGSGGVGGSGTRRRYSETELPA